MYVTLCPLLKKTFSSRFGGREIRLIGFFQSSQVFKKRMRLMNKNLGLGVVRIFDNTQSKKF